MKKRYLLLLPLALLPGLYLLMPSPGGEPDQARQQSLAETRLQKVSMQCKVKADAAIAHKVPIIEFQKLEMESQREWVFCQCMKDQGYSENPAWQTAAESRFSDSEQLKRLRRTQMQLISAQDDLPAFWLAPK